MSATIAPIFAFIVREASGELVRMFPNDTMPYLYESSDADQVSAASAGDVVIPVVVLSREEYARLTEGGAS